MGNVLLTALGVGGATVIGAALGVIFKKATHRFSDIVLAFAAGVMLAAAVFGLILPAVTEGGKYGLWIAVLGIFVGALCLNFTDKMVPHLHNLMGRAEESHNNRSINRVLLFVTAIAIHNFPEGLATFAISLNGLDVALPIIIAIALHNIPEGIAVAVPIHQATGSRWKALLYSLLAGLSEPLGALIGFIILMPFWNTTIEAAIFGITAGIMVYISIDELLPTSERYGHHHLSILGVVVGMIFMALSLIIL